MSHNIDTEINTETDENDSEKEIIVDDFLKKIIKIQKENEIDDE